MTHNLSLLFLSVLLLIGSARAQQDPYCDGLVHDVVSTQVILSPMEKAITRLGDRAAVAVIRSIGDREIHDAVEMKRILWLLQTAFSVPQNIAEAADQTPKATLFLLRYTSETPMGRQMAGEIENSRNTILSAASYGQRGTER